MQKKFLELAQQAADEFASGNLIGGLAIAGVVMIVVSSSFAFVAPTIETLSEPQVDAMVLMCTLFFVGGLIAFIGAAVLFYRKVSFKSKMLMLLTDQSFELTKLLLTRVRDGCVNIDDVDSLSQRYFKSSMELLGKSNQGETETH